MRYEDGQWRVIDPSDRLKLSKTEGQVWLTLYQLLMDKDCQQKYEFNSYNKAVILKVRTKKDTHTCTCTNVYSTKGL